MRDRFLFTGDHRDWDRNEQRLAASEDYRWYSRPQQAESMRRSADYAFEWVLPGHGRRVRAEVLQLTDAKRRGDR